MNQSVLWPIALRIARDGTPVAALPTGRKDHHL